jgi:hypothetical protein
MICNFDQRSQPSDQLRAKFEIALHAKGVHIAFLHPLYTYYKVLKLPMQEIITIPFLLNNGIAVA